MIIGVPTEIKNNEYRISLIPVGVKQLVTAGHKVVVQRGAGEGSGLPDELFTRNGATIMNTAEEVFERAEMIIKVKEPLESEYTLLRRDQLLFTYLHLAASPACTKALMNSKVAAMAYETIEFNDGSLPLLKPMSEVAGRMAVQVGAFYLQKENGGAGVLLGGIPGVQRGHVAIIGAGVVGLNAAKMAVGLGASVKIFDRNQNRLEYLDDIFGNRIETLMSDPEAIAREVERSDLVVGAVLIAGAKAPRLVTDTMIKTMRPGSVMVDVSVDQGGCFESTRATTHENPTYCVHDVIHYCVANIPGAVARTSTFALFNATFPFTLKLANKGLDKALAEDPALAKGLNVRDGKIIHPAVRKAFESTLL